MIFRRILSASWKAAAITFVGLVSIYLNIHIGFLVIDAVTYLSLPIVMLAGSLFPEKISDIAFQVSIIAANFIMWMVVLTYVESLRPPRKPGGSLSILQQ